MFWDDNVGAEAVHVQFGLTHRSAEFQFQGRRYGVLFRYRRKTNLNEEYGMAEFEKKNGQEQALPQAEVWMGGFSGLSHDKTRPLRARNGETRKAA